MASGLRGLLAGSLALVALQAVVGSRQGSDRVGGLALSAGRVAESFLSPAVPGFGWGTAKAASPTAAGVAVITAPTQAPAYPDPRVPPLRPHS
ncbi:MAG: hypothetical protein ACR2MO_08580 [Acidimicrobiales bacterium]